MGLFEKRNPKANARTVLVHAFACACVGALVFFFFAKPAYKDAWPVTLPIWLAGCAGMGALWEWQVTDPE
jgi:hypothetical protein